MNQTPSQASEPFEAMPFAKEIRASSKYSAELRRQVDQLFELMREPLVSEVQAKARLEALQGLCPQPFFGPNPTAVVQKPAVSSGGTWRLPSSKLI